MVADGSCILVGVASARAERAVGLAPTRIMGRGRGGYQGVPVPVATTSPAAKVQRAVVLEEEGMFDDAE